VTAGDNFWIECERFGIAVAGTHRIGRTYGKAVNYGPIKWGCIDRRYDIMREHARARRGKHHRLGIKRREVQMAFETNVRLFG
jgi:hypothetical protein